MSPTSQPLVQSRQLGRWRIHAIQAGGQRFDGGAMFGVVPKMLWQRRIPADERNRIQLGMRCLLVEHDIGPVLIDTGAGFEPHEVVMVINSHLHFDHAGGNTLRDTSGEIRPSLPNARYVKQKGEYHY